MTAVLNAPAAPVAHPFPSVPNTIDGFAECVERLAAAIETERLATGTPASATFEASLSDRVDRLVEEWRGRGDLVRIAHILDSDSDMQALRAWARARALSPNSLSCPGVGPTKTSLASAQAWAKSAFSDRKP